MRICVTQEDIDGGIREDCSMCPIARTATRAYGRPMDVGNWMIRERSRGFRAGEDVAGLPHSAQVFILDFDAGSQVEPFEFDDIPIADQVVS